MYVCIFLSQDGFYWRGLWVGWHHLLWGDIPSFDLQRGFLHMYSQRRSPWLQGWGICGLLSSVWSGFSSSFTPDILEYLSIGDRLPGAHLSPTSKPLCKEGISIALLWLRTLEVNLFADLIMELMSSKLPSYVLLSFPRPSPSSPPKPSHLLSSLLPQDFSWANSFLSITLPLSPS